MSGRILVVDDEYDLLHAVCGFLEDEGFDVQPCSSGEEALSILRAGNRPDLVLLDVMMPGLSGFEVAEQIRALDGSSHIAVVMMSAVSPDRMAKNGTFEAFLSKPFEIDKLLDTVGRYVR